jgi:dipeptidyl aminopeptidase/acylaminoacyl peptidase
MGAGFATNLSGGPSRKQIERIQNIGTYIPIKIDGVDGGLIAKSNDRRPAVVYVHGRSANRTESLPLAEALFEEGYNAVLWDSSSRQISYGPREIDQIRRIVESVRSDPHVLPDEIYLVGFSLGAAMALGTAAADTDGHIRGVVADSPYADLRSVASRYVSAFGVIPKPVAWPAQEVTFAAARVLHNIEFETRNPSEWATRIACPILLIHGKSDKAIPYTHSIEILERLRFDKELWLVEGAGHTNRDQFLNA